MFLSSFDDTDSEKDKEWHICQQYFLAISTVLKTKARYPLKPAGTSIFRKLEQISLSLNNTLQVFDSKILRNFDSCLQRLSTFNHEVECLESIFSMIRKIASIIGKKYPTEEKAIGTLKNYILSLQDHRDIVSSWICSLQKNFLRWLPKLFCYISYPVLPNTNNDLETFNLKLKKLSRKITGRKNSHLFLFSSGVPVAFAISTDLLLSPLSCSFFSHSQIINEAKSLFKKTKRSSVHAIKTDLSEFLFKLECLA